MLQSDLVLTALFNFYKEVISYDFCVYTTNPQIILMLIILL